MRRLHLIIYVTLLTLATQAQETVREQLLVFRNTGETNLLFTHEVDSIITDGTAQTFYTKDTVLVVPINEIDSVAVGNRNVRELNKAVRELTTERDLPWLIRTEDGHLYYRNDTPADLLPAVGEKLFYGDSHALMPSGLAARVVSVSKGATEIDVAFEEVELEEIFDQLFYSGRLEMTEEAAAAARSLAPKDPQEDHAYEPIPLELELKVGNIGTLCSKGTTEVNADFVIDVRNHYYNAHITADTEVGLEFNFTSHDSGELNLTCPRLRIPLPVIASVLHPSFYVNLFVDVKAEMSINMSMMRHYHYEYDWTRRNGEQHGEVVEPTEEKPAVRDEAKAQLLINGEIFAGVQVGANLALTGDRVGFRFDLKAGRYMEGKLGVGVLRDLRNYNSDLFAEASINDGYKLALQASLFRHDFLWFFGDEVEDPLFQREFKLGFHTRRLFPRFERTMAVALTRQNEESSGGSSWNDNVNAATTVEEIPPADTEAGFEILDAQGEVVDSVFVDAIKGSFSEDEEEEIAPRILEGTISLNKIIDREELASYTVRPVFHYLGYTISAAPVGIRKDVLLQPYIATGSKGGMIFVSGYPFIGSVKASDDTIYQVGNSLPLPNKTPDK